MLFLRLFFDKSIFFRIFAPEIVIEKKQKK
jgi:hypothetical protein